MRKFLRFSFYHFYHSFSWTYDFVAAVVSVGRWKDWVFAVLPYIQGPRVLEIGFGPGHLQIQLNRLGFQTFGLDESRQMLRQAQANLARNHLPVALSRGYAQSLPFATSSLDSVVATFPSEYIANRLTLAEIQRVLKPGGRLVIIPMAWIWGKSITDKAMKWLFSVTSQGEAATGNLEGRIKSTFAEGGFRVEIVYAEIRHSTALIIIAEVDSEATSQG
jgi:ubiquinone/menaquinone biosynthesis C-methylase UbiE